MRAIDIIHDEHRSLAAVLHGMLFLVREIRLDDAVPDFNLLGAMIYYIDAFPERFHHPKEDAYLFKRLLQRSPDAAVDVERVSSEHRRGAYLIRTLEQTLTRYQQGGLSQFAAFAEAVTAYAAFHWDHMRFEEDVLIPKTRLHLTAKDWEEIDAAFLGHTDPLFGAKAGAEYEDLFRRIARLAPPPIGVGPASSRGRANPRSEQ